MSLLQRGADTFYAYRFLKLLVTDWKDTEAYELGIIDENGRRLKKPTTSEEKSAYTYFHRLVFNIKRLLEKIPAGRTRLASFAAALYLIKEDLGMSDYGIKKILSRLEFDSDLSESTWILNEEGALQPGIYTLRAPVPLVTSGEYLALKGSKITVKEATAPHGYIQSVPIFYVHHNRTKQIVAVTPEDLIR